MLRNNIEMPPRNDGRMTYQHKCLLSIEVLLLTDLNFQHKCLFSIEALRLTDFDTKQYFRVVSLR